MSIPAFPKIFALGTVYINDIFFGEVEVTEKVDGSQFAFGRVNGELVMRSKGAVISQEAPEKMFAEAVEYVKSIKDVVPDGYAYYCEYLRKPKHNTLTYDRIPANHLMLFGVSHLESGAFLRPSPLAAEGLGVELVPVIYKGTMASGDVKGMMSRESVLGGTEIEGLVVKNYSRPFWVGDQALPIMSGKLVSEKFKEVHRGRWKAEETGKGKTENFYKSFRTEARWNKAVQHLKELGLLDGAPHDIGKIIKEIHADIESEESENIKEFLYRSHLPNIKRMAISGVAEWYKNLLVGGMP